MGGGTTIHHLSKTLPACFLVLLESSQYLLGHFEEIVTHNLFGAAFLHLESVSIPLLKIFTCPSVSLRLDPQSVSLRRGGLRDVGRVVFSALLWWSLKLGGMDVSAAQPKKHAMSPTLFWIHEVGVMRAEFFGVDVQGVLCSFALTKCSDFFPLSRGRGWRYIQASFNSWTFFFKWRLVREKIVISEQLLH